ncbi:MAG: LptF/LptG family permease [Bacteroidia bacterium]|nr:LptF/LptG family permease [Bacteroidia bacterium]
MKKLDKYIISRFLGTFIYAILLIVLIAIIFDISEKIDDFIQSKAPVKAIVFEYYFNFIPFFVNLFSPLFTFIAVVFFTSKMAGNTEIVAILSSGVSFNRLLRPYMLAATVLAFLSFFLNNYVIPKANAKRLNFENTYIRNKYRNSDINIHRQIKPGEYIYFEQYNNFDDIGSQFSYEVIKDGKLVYKLMARQIRFDTITQKWKVIDYTIRTINGYKENLKSGHEFDTIYNFTPADFGTRLNNIETMNRSELNAFISEEKLRGSDEIPFYELEKHRRVSMPFATFILTLIGVSMASRKVRGGIGLHIGLGMLISFSYILFLQVSSTFATNGNLSPILAVWIPNILYLFIALVLLKLAPK